MSQPWLEANEPMFHATRPALVQITDPDLITIQLFLDATNDDDVSVFPSHSPSLIPLMGTNWRHKKLSQKREPFNICL